MSSPSPVSVVTARQQRAFSFLEVLLVLGIIGLMIICLIGFVLSRNPEPLKIPSATPAPATAAPPAPTATPAP